MYKDHKRASVLTNWMSSMDVDVGQVTVRWWGVSPEEEGFVAAFSPVDARPNATAPVKVRS